MENTPPLPTPTTPAPEPTQIPPVPETPIAAVPVQPFSSVPRRKFPTSLLTIVGVLAILGIGALIGNFSRSKTPPSVAPAATPTAMSTPTPFATRKESLVASQAAFLRLNEAVQTMSAAIGSYNTQDPTLSPPVLELPLGFSTN